MDYDDMDFDNLPSHHEIMYIKYLVNKYEVI